ncbi:MAG: uracil-DNA glycosylase 2 [Bacteroidia bacterium]|nr:MAG: uracil-DNA glycosylase 2 [Bacteroidia bacterium]
MSIKIEESWKKVLNDIFQKDYFQSLIEFVKSEYKTKTIYPPGSLIFHAFDRTPFDKVKVIIIGQDPYHGAGQAHGLCFSVNKGVPIPPSLQNIYKELKRDVGIEPPNHGCLSAWADQGVLLLNAILTVEAGKASSHKGKGWETFTDEVIQVLNDQKEHLVFLLWGKFAQEKGKNINRNKHLVLTANHPSPLANPSNFIGCGHFSQTNAYLQNHGIEPINWAIPD